MESGDIVYCAIIGARTVKVEPATFIRSLLLPGTTKEAVYVEFDKPLCIDGHYHIHGLFDTANVFETRAEAERAAKRDNSLYVSQLYYERMSSH